MPEKGSAFILIIIAITLLLGGYAAAVKTDLIKPLPILNKIPFIPTPTPTPKQTACTQDAKQCPDGSYVARSGPKCEFAPCPAIPSADMKDWKTYTSTKYKLSFKYPNNYLLTEADPTVLLSSSKKLKDELDRCLQYGYECNLHDISIEFHFFNKPANQSLLDFIKNQPGSGDSSQYKEISLGGYKAMQAIDYDENNAINTTFVNFNSKVLYIQGSSTQYRKKNFSIYNQIFSTFKFTQ